MRKEGKAKGALGFGVRAGLGLAVAISCLGSAMAAEPDAPGEDGPPAWAYAIAGELLSPFCPGRTLTECPSPQAESLRMWIIVQAAAGRSRADVEAELFERYGDDIRPTPRAEGIGISAYLLPAFAFFGGGGLLAWFLYGATSRERPEMPMPTLDADAERRLDEALATEPAAPPDEVPKP